MYLLVLSDVVGQTACREKCKGMAWVLQWLYKRKGQKFVGSVWEGGLSA